MSANIQPLSDCPEVAKRGGMRTPYGLNIIENCPNCPVKDGHLFCNLPGSALRRLAEITSPAVYPESATLFVEGQRPRGVFILCAGRVKLFTSSSSGKTIITKLSEHRDLLGLNAVISNRTYEVTAEMIEPGQANFIARDAFLTFLLENGDAGLRVMEQLSRNYYAAYETIRILGLVDSPAEKFARLLLSWYHNNPAQPRLTHEEIAEMIGTTRETVSRLFSEFKRKHLLQAEGAILTIRNKMELERILRP